MDFIAVGDTTVDEFILLQDAAINDAKGSEATITLPWGDKIPYRSSVLVPAVGNAANAAVAAARLGLASAFVSNVGKDRYGEDILAALLKESVDTSYVAVHEEIPTNHHYVLSYGAERTILIRHEAYPYALPERFRAPKWLYLSSLGEHSEAFHHELALWLSAHPETKLAFQPGTFQMRLGTTILKELYERTDVIACNREEAQIILGRSEPDMRTLLTAMRALGPKTVLVTDGIRGAYGYDGTEMLHVPMYPDAAPPVDRTGAGDATSSSFVAALAYGLPLAEALRWGPVNAMSVVRFIGAQEGLLTRDALEAHLASAPSVYRAESVGA